MSPRKKIYIFLIIFLVIFFSFPVLIIPYFFQEITKNSQDLVLSKDELAFLKKEEKNIKELESVYQNYQENLARIDKILISFEEPIEFIDFLEKNAQNFNQKIGISLMTSKEAKEDPWPTLNFQIQTSGSFTNFLKFLDKLENSPHLIEIANLNIQKLSERELKETPGDIQTNFQIKVFAQ